MLTLSYTMRWALQPDRVVELEWRLETARRRAAGPRFDSAGGLNPWPR
jgi:hypothetical protein